MGRHPTPHCKQGHPWTDTNTYHFTDIDGVTRRRCRRCMSIKSSKAAKHRYRHDPEWRELKKAYAREYYYANKPKVP